METSLILISGLFFLVALLYACVGHAGASGYLAVMAVMGFAPATMKPTALALNIFVASIASIKFYRAGAFSKHIFIPLIITSIPSAYIGGLISLPTVSLGTLSDIEVSSLQYKPPKASVPFSLIAMSYSFCVNSVLLTPGT